ncbi:hypothetical protein DM02DRAFT_299121 [Periconia macrospinosa]|uniref:Uncharacterized protein n=1 Tax=Periconia macrospinosa TaxID=97972 RepID=A0A2V1E0C5_9PLEO|nr:hypothetical protein DM02DRAFT_299121 [Periconia macrospinosa]
MGRQAYLTKIALGRSAFEPSQPASSDSQVEYIQLTSSQQELPPEATNVSSNQYIQVYDERGNPINPRAHEHGRRLREAQNDVLASIGVVERRRSPSHDLPGSNAARLQQLDDEEMAGNVIALTSTIAENICTWWIGSLRDRILTFRYQDALPFSRIVALESATSGRSLIHAGFESRLASTISIQSFVYAFVVFRPLDRLLVAMSARSRTRKFYRRWREYTKPCLRICLELIFYPLIYHSYLQRLGLQPARPFLPPWRSFIPFSKWSPLTPFSIHHAATSSVSSFFLAILTSPFTLICLKHSYERWAYTSLSHTLETIIMHPDCPDMRSADHAKRDRTTSNFGFRKSLPHPLHSVMEKIINFLGWGQTTSSQETQDRTIQQEDDGGRQTIETSATEVTNLNRLENIPRLQGSATASTPQIVGTSTAPIISLSGVSPPPRPSSPSSPTASQTRQSDDNDPRIRITSREGIVEMEVRLPAQVLSQHTELAEAGQSTPSRRDADSPAPPRTILPSRYHRVTQLSTEPSQMLAGICKTQIVTWMSLPLKIITLHSVAAHYYSTGGGHVDTHRILHSLPSLSVSDLSWTSIGWQVSRIALCASLDLAIDLTIWGCSFVAIVITGTHDFGWGTL